MSSRFAIVIFLCLSLVLPGMPVLAVTIDTGDVDNSATELSSSHVATRSCHHEADVPAPTTTATSDQAQWPDSPLTLDDCCGHCDCGCVPTHIPASMTIERQGLISLDPASPRLNSRTSLVPRPPLRPPIHC